MANKKKYNQHCKHNKKNNHNKPTNFEEYQVGDMTYEEMCEYADFLNEFFNIAEGIDNEKEKTLEDYGIFEEEGPQR